ALLTNGRVRCWGSNGFGQLGDGMGPGPRLAARAVDVLSDVAAISAGEYHTCALTIAGGVRCWGNNESGQLGDGLMQRRLSPPATDVLSGVRALSTAGDHTCAVTADGGVRCWGRADSGRLGNGSDQPNS